MKGKQSKVPGSGPERMTGAEVAALIHQHGLRSKDLAKMVGVQPQTINRWKHAGVTGPGRVLLRLIDKEVY